MREIIPQQIQYNTPYQQLILHQNTQDSKVYLSRTSNYILNAIGNDLILNGFNIISITTESLSTVKIRLSPGLLIQDTTLISIEEETELSIDVLPYDNNNGYLIIYTDYQYLNLVQENNLKLKLSYISADGDSIEPSTDIWDPNKNRILLYRFSFIKLPQATLTQITTPTFTIFNREYFLNGENNFTNYQSKLLDHAVDGPTYGYATTTKAGHVRIGENINIDNGTISILNASTTTAGVLRFATEEEALALVSQEVALTPDSIRHLILNIKDIEVQVTDPGVTLGTALILS
mgnify:FL=1